MSTAQTIDAERLRATVAPITVRHRLRNHGRAPLLKGVFNSYRLGAGMTVHCVQAQELANCASTGECPPGLSLTIVLAGTVNFCLGSRHYRVEADDEPVGLGIQLARPEPFTRYLERGQWVSKVNVSVSDDWLTERFGECPQWTDAPDGVGTWQPGEGQKQLSRELMAMAAEPANGQTLTLEARALELVASVLSVEPGRRPGAPSPAGPSLAELVEPCISGRVPLKAVAERLGMSVSTLQRRFKRDHGVTVMDYLRGQRLELARNALLLENCSVQQAAYLAGYEHASNFIQAFRRLYDITPAELVRRHQSLG